MDESSGPLRGVSRARWGGGGATAKLALLVLVGAGTACALLAVRQQRLEAVGAMADSLRRSAALDRTTALVRVEIARRITPERIAWLAQRYGPWESTGVPQGERALYAHGVLPGGGAEDGDETGVRSAGVNR